MKGLKSVEVIWMNPSKWLGSRAMAQRMSRFRFFIAVLGSMSVFLTGCGSARYSERERSNSFVPFRAVRVEQLSLHDYLGNGCGILLEGVQFSDMDSTETEFESKDGTVASNGKWSIGTATAIDKRGYFITAAHCVDGGSLSLIFPSSNGPKIREARVVWKGDLSETGMDFALLHVPASVDQVFPWSSAVVSDKVVISAGATLEMSRDVTNNLDIEIQIEPVAGRIANALELHEGGLNYQVILHDCPVVRGYSGGPLVDKYGQLIAINSNGRSRVPMAWNERSRFANAIRPNLEWLTSLIIQDQNKRSGQN